MEIDFSKQEKFYKEYEEIGPWLVLGLIIISFGVYVLIWIYSRNKEFELIDKHAPLATRGITIMMVFPAIWFFLIFGIKYFFNNIVIKYIEIFGWILISFLILKYIFDFCESFERITGNNRIYYFILMFIPFICVPVMQKKMNSYFKRVIIRRKTKDYYS